jgi:hypothetical protein
MSIDDQLKELMQLCADLQDGFSEAAMHAGNPDLAALLQADAVQWNTFADRVFPILLAIDHTSPDAYWTSDPDRPWMSTDLDLDCINDLTLCEECIRGLRIAQQRLQTAANASLPSVRHAVSAQLTTAHQQIEQVVQFVADTDRLTA